MPEDEIGQMTYEKAEEIIGEYLGRIWEDTKFNRALLYYDSELRRLKNDDHRASRC